MKPCLVLLVTMMILLSPRTLPAQPAAGGLVTGTVTDRSTDRPLQDANAVLIDQADSTQTKRVTTDKSGAFTFAQVPPGTYTLECSYIGHRTYRSPEFRLSTADPKHDFRVISLTESAFALDEVAVTSEKNLFNQAIDRRIYNVDRDLMARSSTVADLLQNIPSVQVDLDGNVSLRGSTDVMVLVNGKQSTLMGKSRADVLQQLPAGSVEKIEVITNPSARYTPEGTSGIINIVMRQGAAGGTTGNITAHAGTAGRYNAGLDFSTNPGMVGFFGNYSFRSDRRTRKGTDARSLTPGLSGPYQDYHEANETKMRPKVHIGGLGFRYHPGEHDNFELSGEYFHRRPSRDTFSIIVSHDSTGEALRNYDQKQTGYESESEAGVTGAYEHTLPRKDEELRLEAGGSDSPQKEVAHFAHVYRVPAAPDQPSTIILTDRENRRHLSIDYTDPLPGDSKLEAGFDLERTREDIGSEADLFDLAEQAFRPDPLKSYRFRMDQTVQALYGTYEHPLGSWDSMVGLRTEYTRVKSDLVTSGEQIDNNYFGLYPTLHLSYKVDENRQVQVNYSRRINRPRSDDLNPFAEYTDPYNMEAGNPRLKPESVHAIELGYQLRNERFTFVPSIYYRYKQNGFTRLTRAVNDSTFERIPANLAKDQSAGLEPVLTATFGTVFSANLNADVFYDQIDASNIGYSSRKSVVSWSGTFTCNYAPARTTMFQVNANYRSERLTPQGNMRPSFGLNLGARQDLPGERLSLTATISDLFKTQRQETQLEVAGIHQHVTTKRDSQVAYFGLSYQYGRPEKKAKEKTIQYEDQPQ